MGKSATDLIKARIKQLEERVIEAYHRSRSSKERYDFVDGCIKDMGENKSKEGLLQLQKRKEELLKENKEAISELDRARLQLEEAKGLLKILEEGEDDSQSQGE